MRRTFSSSVVAMLIVFAGSTAGVVHAQQLQPQRDAQPSAPSASDRAATPRPASSRPEARSDNSHNSLSDSVRRVQREPGVRVLSAERVPFDGRDINRIKYVDERGRVRYMDDAGSSRRRSSSAQGEPAPAQTPARGDNPPQP